MKIMGYPKPLGQGRDPHGRLLRAPVGASHRHSRTSPETISFCPANEAVFKHYPLFPALVVWPLHAGGHWWHANYFPRRSRLPLVSHDGLGVSSGRAPRPSAINSTPRPTKPSQSLAGLPKVNRRADVPSQLGPRQTQCPNCNGRM